MGVSSSVVFFSLILWVLNPAARAQQSRTQIPVIFSLHNAEVNTLAVAPPVPGSSQCDARENVFFESSDRRYSTPVIMRVSEYGTDEVPFSLPNDQDGGGEWRYSVDQLGGIYVLYSKAETHILSHLSFPGATLDRRILQLPRHFHIHSFAVLPDHTAMMFIGGIPGTDSVLSLWLDTDGKLLRVMKSEEDTSSVDNINGLVADGDGDTFIEVIGSEIQVFNMHGDALKTFSIIRPTEDSFATKLQLIDGSIAVAFSRSVASISNQMGGTNIINKQVWLLVDASNGDVRGFYKMPDNFAGSMLCYLGDSRFLTFSIEDGRNMFVEADQ